MGGSVEDDPMPPPLPPPPPPPPAIPVSGISEGVTENRWSRLSISDVSTDPRMGTVIDRNPTRNQKFGLKSGSWPWHRYNHGLYAYWDAVRHRGQQLNPAFAIDNCASGGNRIDLESLVRTVFLWRSGRGTFRSILMAHAQDIFEYRPII